MVPYVTAFVELEDGVRMPDQPGRRGTRRRRTVKIGMACEVVFDDVNDTITLPKFKPA